MPVHSESKGASKSIQLLSNYETSDNKTGKYHWGVITGLMNTIAITRSVCLCDGRSSRQIEFLCTPIGPFPTAKPCVTHSLQHTKVATMSLDNEVSSTRPPFVTEHNCHCPSRTFGTQIIECGNQKEGGRRASCREHLCIWVKLYSLSILMAYSR